MRFCADDDSFNENLVKENRSEISGRWELKMAAFEREGGGKEEVMGGLKGGLRRTRGHDQTALRSVLFLNEAALKRTDSTPNQERAAK